MPGDLSWRAALNLRYSQYPLQYHFLFLAIF
jgi:hypothetical protein